MLTVADVEYDAHHEIMRMMIWSKRRLCNSMTSKSIALLLFSHHIDRAVSWLGSLPSFRRQSHPTSNSVDIPNTLSPIIFGRRIPANYPRRHNVVFHRYSFSTLLGKNNYDSSFLFLATEDASSVTDVKSWDGPHALLFSSFADGVRQSPEAKVFVQRVLLEKILNESIQTNQREVEDSVLASPCSGPTNLDALSRMELAESLRTKLQSSFSSSNSSSLFDSNTTSTNFFQDLKRLNCQLRLLYVPTAMYALRKDSLNTPGKQRQRARADAKQRREDIIQFLQHDIFVHNSVSIDAVTLDFEVGEEAVRQLSSNMAVVPTLDEWSPHMIYVEGGNTFWLYYCLTCHNHYYWNALHKLVSSASSLYCGKSAGAIVAGLYVETATWKGWDDPSIVPNNRLSQPQNWKGIRGMNFANNVSIFPHFDETFADLVYSKEADIVNGTLVCLSNSQVLAVNGPHMQIYSAPSSTPTY